MSNWTEAELNRRLKAGTIKGFTIQNKKGPAVPMPKIRNEAKQVTWMRGQLKLVEMLLKYKVVDEYKFHKKRKWRFDFAIPELKIAIEYEGLQSEKSGHTTLTGFTSDTEKYNEAQKMGWRVLRYTVLNYKTVVTGVRETIRDIILDTKKI
ncbi:MAG: hypothetical protein WC756_12105 [Taibaiella sp.]|jgi:very-short-patch-repair endonuclease